MNFSPDYSFANSTLDIKASGTVDINNDLKMPEGKSIAELLYEKKENNTTEQRK
jgi:hypothetical protein